MDEQGTVRSGCQTRRHLLRKVIRRFFDERHFLESESPILVRCAGVERHLRFFATQHLHFDHSLQSLFLRTSPELALKVQLSDLSSPYLGLYEIARCFRNHGELGPWHRPEFTMIEWYHRQGSMSDLIVSTIDLIRFVAAELAPYLSVVSLPQNVPHFEVDQIFHQLTGVYLDDQDLAVKCQKFASVTPCDDTETVFFKILLDVIEPYLKSFPLVVLKNYPAMTSGLARVAKGRAQRFEIYCRGIELCNGFQELTGYQEIQRLIEQIQSYRNDQGIEPIQVDESDILALASLQNDYIGNAMGFERLGALLCGESNINAWTISFP